MNYQRPIKRTTGYKNFNVGTHQVKITGVKKTKSSKGNNMFRLFVEGSQGEKGQYFLTFGTEYTDESLTFLIASIEDAGTDIPDLDFGFNRATFDFLLKKDAFIQVEMKEYKGKSQPAITKFLTLDEFEQIEEVEEIIDEDW
ncbi:type III secretion system protein PrgE [Enterococcus faecalis]|nr:type III secretion system protein PrgE [Enterococcus faecalis]